MKGAVEMNCEVAKDLMTLYVEDMCSLESKKALEEHVKECPACAEALKSVKKELEIESIASKSDYTGENASTLKPMKKVKKSLVRRKRTAIILGFLLIAVLTGIGFLSYGQVTNRCMSFSAIRRNCSTRA